MDYLTINRSNLRRNSRQFWSYCQCGLNERVALRLSNIKQELSICDALACDVCKLELSLGGRNWESLLIYSVDSIDCCRSRTCKVDSIYGNNPTVLWWIVSGRHRLNFRNTVSPSPCTLAYRAGTWGFFRKFQEDSHGSSWSSSLTCVVWVNSTCYLCGRSCLNEASDSVGSYSVNHDWVIGGLCSKVRSLNGDKSSSINRTCVGREACDIRVNVKL